MYCILGSAPIINGMATVTVNGLECRTNYTLVAGGVFNNSSLVGPRSLLRNITKSCLVTMMGECSTTWIFVNL